MAEDERLRIIKRTHEGRQIARRTSENRIIRSAAPG